MNPIHPLNGHTLAVRHVARIGGLRVVVAEHPDGGTLTLPGDAHAPATFHADVLFEAGRLVVLANKVAAMRRET